MEDIGSPASRTSTQTATSPVQADMLDEEVRNLLGNFPLEDTEGQQTIHSGLETRWSYWIKE